MVIELLKHWEVAVDGLQIFLCMLILFYLIRNHRRTLKADMVNPKIEPTQDFNFQVFSQTINQQVELAFNNILEVAANERRNLDKVLQFQKLKPTPLCSPKDLPPSHRPHRDDTGRDDRQTSIQQLAVQGKSAKQISDELKAPLGEVELVLSLQKNRKN